MDDTSHLEFGVIYKHYPLRNQGGSNPGNWDYSDVALEARYDRQDTLWGDRTSDSEFALLFGHTAPFHEQRLHACLCIAAKDFFSGFDKTALAQNDLEALPGLWLTSGVAAIWQMRGSDLVFPVTNNLTEHYFTFAPRAGLRCDIAPHFQLFGNVSRSDEVPIPLYLPQAVNNIYDNNADIKAQTQNTIEIGTRGHVDIFT